MKKAISILLILMLLLTACGGETGSQTTEVPTEATLPGSGETVPATEATADQGPEGVTDPPGDTVTVHVLTRMAQLDETGSQRWHREYEYDHLGRKAAESEYDSTGSLTYRQVFTYDEAGLCTASELHQGDAPVVTTTYVYDDLGRVVRQQSLEEGVVISTDEITYDEYGNQLTYKMYFGDELVYDWSYICSYDENGNLLTREEYSGGELVFTVECRYDSLGRPSETLTYRADGTLENRSTFAWEGTTEIRAYYDREDNLYLTSVTTYDDRGNVTFQENQYSGGTVTMTEYTYEPIEILP